VVLFIVGRWRVIGFRVVLGFGVSVSFYGV